MTEVVREIEALTVAADEILVVRLPEASLPDGTLETVDYASRIQEGLHNGPLRGRFVIFVGEVEFAKVAADA